MNLDVEWPDQALKRALELAVTGKAERPMLVDVGAHYGETLNTFCEALPDGFTYIGFEPDPETYSVLVNNFTDARLALGNIEHRFANSAVGPEVGVAQFHRTSADAVSGILAPEMELNNRVPAGDHIVKEVFDVPVATIDDVVAEHGPIDLLKIDTEGFDLECLKGAHSALSRSNISVVMCEAFFVRYRVGQAYFWDIAKFLEQHGYYFVNIFDSRQTHQGRMYTANGVWVSRVLGEKMEYL